MTGKTCFEDLIWQAFCSIYAFYGKYSLIRWMTGGVTTQEKIPRNSRDSGLQSSADRGRGPWGPSLLTVQADWWRPCAMTDGQWQTKRQTHHFIKLNSSFFMQTLQEKVIGLCTRMAALSLSWKPPIDYCCSTSLRADIKEPMPWSQWVIYMNTRTLESRNKSALS